MPPLFPPYPAPNRVKPPGPLLPAPDILGIMPGFARCRAAGRTALRHCRRRTARRKGAASAWCRGCSNVTMLFFGVNFHHLDVVLPLAFAQGVKLILRPRCRLAGGGRTLKSTCQSPKTPMMPVGMILGREASPNPRRWWSGGGVGGIRPKMFRDHNRGVGVVQPADWRLEPEPEPGQTIACRRSTPFFQDFDIRGKGGGGAQAGVQGHTAREADRDFPKALHGFNIPLETPEANRSCVAWR